MLDYLGQIIFSSWQMIVASAAALTAGLTLAGLLSVFFNEKTLKKFLGKGKFRDVFYATMIGIPLPLCSCSVLPVAQMLRKSGVRKGATVSFLVSTPETGADSIVLTYTLLGPFMAVIRPVAAFITAMTAGIVESFYDTNKAAEAVSNEEAAAGCSCCHSTAESDETDTRPIYVKFIEGIKYAYTTLLADLSPYLLLGFLLSGIVVTFMGTDMSILPLWLREGWGGYFGAILLGLPLYICATSSTPLAAAFLVLGFSPGAVLVFLLVGPATNIASLVVVTRIIGGWSVVRYLLIIVGVSVFCGMFTDWLGQFIVVSTSEAAHQHLTEGGGWYSLVTAIGLTSLAGYYTLRSFLRKFKSKTNRVDLAPQSN